MGTQPSKTAPAVAPPVRPGAPEILAPAGDRDTLAAALAAGADAVYFGLDDGFNARARATNFASDSLPQVVAWIHRAGARAYVALNTLVFEPELPVIEELIRRVAAAGADAIIVQDPAGGPRSTSDRSRPTGSPPGCTFRSASSRGCAGRSLPS
jgi:hypothetical protein